MNNNTASASEIVSSSIIPIMYDFFGSYNSSAYIGGSHCRLLPLCMIIVEGFLWVSGHMAR